VIGEIRLEVFDVFGRVAVADENGVFGFDHDEVFHAAEGDDPLVGDGDVAP